VNEQMFDCDGRKRNEHYSYYVNFLKLQKPWDCVVRRQRKLFIWEGEKITEQMMKRWILVTAVHQSSIVGQ
jgi:hypothetical protein